MNDRYDLHESLELDDVASTEELYASLSSQLSEPRDAGISEYSGEFQEKLTTLRVPDDERYRRECDALLADENVTITIATLRGLANRPSSTAPASAFPSTPDQAAQQQSAQPETNANSDAQNEAPWFLLQQRSQQSQAQSQQGQPRRPSPARTGPMTVTTTVTADVPPLPEGTSPQDAQKCLPRFPRTMAGLLAAASALGYILTAATTILGISNLNSVLEAQECDSSLASIEEDIRDTYVELINVNPGAAFFALGTAIAVISMFWFNKVLMGRNIRASCFLVATTGPLGMGLLVMCYSIQDVSITIFARLSDLVPIAVTVLVFLKDMRVWFCGQALVKTTQPAPAQGFIPQYPQSQDTRGYQFGQNNSLNDMWN